SGDRAVFCAGDGECYVIGSRTTGTVGAHPAAFAVEHWLFLGAGLRGGGSFHHPADDVGLRTADARRESNVRALVGHVNLEGHSPGDVYQRVYWRAGGGSAGVGCSLPLRRQFLARVWLRRHRGGFAGAEYTLWGTAGCAVLRRVTQRRLDDGDVYQCA